MTVKTSAKTSRQMRRRIRAEHIFALGFLAIILVGAGLLMLPAASNAGTVTPFSDTLFTAVSATCVTGLVVVDTGIHWSLFGQAVILSLIQIGGIGFMTIAILVMILAKRKISLTQRFLMQNSVSAPRLGGIVRLTKFIALGTAMIEAVGAVLLSFSFVPKYGLLKGIYFSVFHSISAFCNAGFDLFGDIEGNSSLALYAEDPIVNITIMLLVNLGG